MTHPIIANTMAIIGPHESQFPQTLLHLVAKRNGYETIYPYEHLAKGTITLERRTEDIQTGALDVFWNMTNSNLESEFRAIKIPVFRGLYGFRIALISREFEHRFADITTIEQLQRFDAGSGSDWPDTSILTFNNLPTTTALKYNNMFRMLDGGRFDYFPRGLNEPWGEIKNNPSLNLTVDPYLMLRYISPVYFFVKKGNPLGNIIQKTLDDMVENGEFEALFYQDQEVQEALQRASVSQRIVFNLKNPNLPVGTPVDDQRLWFKPALK